MTKQPVVQFDAMVRKVGNSFVVTVPHSFVNRRMLKRRAIYAITIETQELHIVPKIKKKKRVII